MAAERQAPAAQQPLRLDGGASLVTAPRVDTNGKADALQPLAERMRPRSFDEVVGQRRLLANDAPFRRAIEAGRPYSLVFWGPPGCGKTTLARLIATYSDAEFHGVSAVLVGLPEVRRVLAHAATRAASGLATVLFVDEVHRFNKAQQDAFLPAIEAGHIVFIGATTENPSFELNAALLSRCRVHVLDALTPTDIETALDRATHDEARGLAQSGVRFEPDQLHAIAIAADGDVRRALTLAEIAVEVAGSSGSSVVDETTLAAVLADRTRRFDKGGEQFYDQISALHKSVRSSDPDAALYWLTRMLDGGVDPHYVARRLTRMAVEDIGLADPRALAMTIEAWAAFDRLGSPEGELALAQVAMYLATTAKSNAAYVGYKKARAVIAQTGTLDVPLALRNAPTGLMKSLGYGRDYRYDHDEPGGVALGQQCLPDALVGTRFYEPCERGLEAKIRAKLDALRDARAAAQAVPLGETETPPDGES